MYKTTILTVSLAFLVILPATAQLDSQLGSVWTDFQSYSVDLQNYLKTNLGDNLKPVEPQAQTAIYNATGDLNIPNPNTAGQSFRNQNQIMPDSNSDKFENNLTVRSALISNEINRSITRGAVDGFLGINGQNRLKTKLINTENSLKNIGAITNNSGQTIQNFLNISANFPDPTTKVLSQLLSSNQQAIQIQQEQATIVAETFAQTIQTNQSLQYSNLNLANISQQMDEANRARRVDTSAEAARLLRTSSQLDLFGRKPE